MRTFCLVAIWALGTLAWARGFGDEKRFLTVAGFYGMGGARYLNANGNFTNYQTTNYGGEVQVQFFDTGLGDIRLFARQQFANNSGAIKNGEKMVTSESVYGLVLYTPARFFMAAGWGPGKSTLTSTNQGTSLNLTYDVVRVALGFDLELTNTLCIGIEGDYRSAPVRQSENAALSHNTNYEGFGAQLRLTWSPSSVTVKKDSLGEP